MEAPEIIFEHLKKKGFDVTRNDNIIKYNKPFMKEGTFAVVAPRQILFEGTRVTISGNLPEPVIFDLCSPASIQGLIDILDSDVAVPLQAMGLQGTFDMIPKSGEKFSIGYSAKLSPRSSEDRAPVSGTGDEGSSPSGGTNEIKKLLFKEFLDEESGQEKKD